ncbi:dolichyl-phosphate beta-glucosyltransferase [Basidiobolus ranarum]|uniref:dolichyl-phosphate beta-glucosyltransferase n=1 Tax=Basidiobolus ranarum TaxID=34480 RepID=A0ABR2W3X4_9FUNG
MAVITLLALSVVLLIACVVVFLTVASPKPRQRTENERYCSESFEEKKKLLPSLFDEPSVTLSVVVPAYNETARLPIMLAESVEFLNKRVLENPEFKYEILVVDDGSKDKTTQIALEFGKKNNVKNLRVLTLEKNRGKGGAVTQGILSARGEYILFADADGATRFSDLQLLEVELNKITKNDLGIAIGSRAHLVQTEAVVKRSLIRNLLMHSFHKVLYLLGIRKIADTQCGFKLFTRTAAQSIFPNTHVEGWIFDIEVLLIAEYLGIPIAEVSVNWHEVDGSKISLIRDSIRMATDLLVIRLNYIFGLWRVDAKIKRN